MARLYNNFEFTGELAFPKEATTTSEMGQSGWMKKRQSLIIKDTKKNGAFVQLEAIYHPQKESKVFTSLKGLFGEKMLQVQIPWDDRLKESIVDSVPDFKKIIVDLTPVDTDKTEFFNTRREVFNLEKTENPTQEDKDKLVSLYAKLRELLPERKEFLHTFDAIDYLDGKLESLKGKKLRVKGDIVKSYYNGKFYTNYEPKTIELVSDENVNDLKLNLDLFFKKGAVDDKSKQEDTVYFDTYIIGYDRQHKKDVLFPFATVLNTSKLDLTNEKHQAILNMQKKYFENVKNKEVNHIAVIAKLVRGAEEVEFNETHLTSSQREMVELGLASLDDYKPKNAVYGENVEEIRVIKPVLHKFDNVNDFTEGSLVSVFEPSDLDYVAVDGTSTKQESTIEVKEDDSLPDPFENETDLDSLFG